MATPRKAPEDRRKPGPKPRRGETKTASVTLTTEQIAHLAAINGTTYAGLQAAVEHYLAARPARGSSKPSAD